MATTSDTKKNRARRQKLAQMPPVEAAEVEEAPPPEENAETGDEIENEGEDPASEQHAGRPKAGETRSPSVRFFDKWNATENFEENAEYWLFRIEPITDRDAQGKPRFIQLYAEPMDENKIMRLYGSGVYKVMVKSRKEGGPMQLRETLKRLEIENPDYPPRIEPGDWLEDRKNKRWAWAKKYYDADTAKAAGGSNTSTLGEVISVVREVLDARLPATPAAGPKDDSIIAAFNAGIAAVRAATPAQQGPDTGTAALLAILQAQNAQANERANKMEERFLDLLKERSKPSEDTQKPRTADEELEHHAKLVESARKIAGRGGHEEHPGWGILRDTLVPAVTAGAPVVLTLMADAQRRKWAEDDAKRRAQQPAPRPQQQPQAQQVAMQPQPQQQPQEEAVPIVQVPEVLQRHFQLALEKCLEGQDPRDFADWLNAGYPTAIADLRRIGSEDPPMPWSGKPPAEAIMDIAKHQPIWTMIAAIPNAEERLTVFITGVLQWTPAQENEEEAEG